LGKCGRGSHGGVCGPEEIGESTLYLTVTCRNTKASTVYELSNKHKSEVNFLVTKK